MDLASNLPVIGLRDVLAPPVDFSLMRGGLPAPLRHFRYDRSGGPTAITIFTDNSLLEARQDTTSDVKIAWIWEPPEISGHAYEYVMQAEGQQVFDLVLTHASDLAVLSPKFAWAPFGGCWIADEDWKIYDKSANCSVIASSKTFMQGHQLRHMAIASFSGHFDAVFGRGINPIDNKIDGLRDFRFSLTIENTRLSHFFTEKLIDCFATGTVPIYWGSPGIERFFNVDGMIVFNDLDELARILPRLNEDEYEKRRDAVEENFELFRQYATTEDYVFETILQPGFGKYL